MNTDLIQIASCASKAPSGHNSQPWKFRMAANKITIIPNFEASLPVVDKDNRELFISLGCAVENLLISASHFGYTAHIIQCSRQGITVELTKTEVMIEDVLFAQIEKRQTNRSVFNGKKISDELLKQLQTLRKEDSVQFYFAEMGTSFANTITEYIMKGNEIQMNDTLFKKELLSWMRFNRKQVEVTLDGLCHQVFGNPPLPIILARPIVNQFLKPKVQNKSDKKKIESSSHFVVCTTQKNTIEEWINLGRTLQRFLLSITKMGISYAFLNQPCEITRLALTLQEELPINKEYPALIIRIGYANPVPYSPRKKIESLLV